MTPPGPKGLLPCLILLTAAIAAAQECDACDEPVFRYALSSWDTDAYALTVYNPGSLTPDQQKALSFLEKASFEKGGKANFLLRVLKENPPAGAAGGGKTQAPWMVLSYPGPAYRKAWAGPLTEENARALADSPARRELAELLLDGESVPWILVESGRTGADDKAAALLEKELAALPERLRKETLEATPPGEKPRDLKVSFPLYRIRRNDPAERIFLAVLLGVKKGLAEKALDGPVVFPLFGRGRILEALAGPEIDARAALKACRFLAGPCACEVKGMAPGLDMLFSADWEKADIQPLLSEIDLPPLTGLPSGKDAGEGEGEAKGRKDAPPSGDSGKKPMSTLPAPVAPVEGAGQDNSGQGGEDSSSSLPQGFGRIILLTLAFLAAALGGLAVFFLKGKGGEG